MGFDDPWMDYTHDSFVREEIARRRRSFLPGRRPLRSLLGLGVLVAAGSWLLQPSLEEPPQIEPLPAIEVPPVETFEVRSLREGETLGEILTQAALPATEQYTLLLAFREQASPRRMRVGTEILLRRRVEDRWLRGVDVRLNPDETVRLTRDDWGWSSDLLRTPVVIDTVTAAGVIDDVLWNAIVEHPDLQEIPREDRARFIHYLDQIFQWRVDFHRQIRSGDRYRFVFEREARPDGSMRAGHVVAAELVNQGMSFHAIWFDPDGDGLGTYYDLEGESVRRAFLLRPIPFSRISSRFSNSRYHPVLRRWRAHRGVDFAAGYGTPIEATGDGVVTVRGRRGGLGNAVYLRHANGFETRYGHLQRFAEGMRVGDRVRQGQVIGYVGSTGLATGPHVHYEMIRHGGHVDPLAIDLPAGDPVPADAWERWEAARSERLTLLHVLPGMTWASRAAPPLPRTDADDRD